MDKEIDFTLKFAGLYTILSIYFDIMMQLFDRANLKLRNICVDKYKKSCKLNLEYSICKKLC